MRELAVVCYVCVDCGVS